MNGVVAWGTQEPQVKQQDLPVSRTRATAIELWSDDDYNMVSSWTDSLWLTKRKDGTFSVKPKKYVEGKNWQLDSVCKLRTPEQFVEGVIKAWEAVGRDWGYGEVRDPLPTVATLDPDFAARIEHYLDEEEETDGKGIE